ncbi:MAG: prolyl oligopeptidase family serine peptidase [Cyclobacteriaceae bacterium]|nr:S9 family peptidase [Cyclobacteriaceae bacterium]MCH8515012.1 prolyl oligopeptidase family serine peptidase [Cyclobacteriaceae bacterium]
MKQIKLYGILLLCLQFLGLSLKAQEAGYQKPGQAIADLIEAPSTPSVSISSNGSIALLIENPGYPDLMEVAQPEVRLAGVRINPVNNGPSRSSYSSGVSILYIQEGREVAVSGLPDNAKLSSFSWSPDESKAAFLNTTEDDISLWYLDIESAKVKKLISGINDAYYGTAFSWVNDSELLVKRTAKDRGEMPKQPRVPSAPIIQSSTGDAAPSRTYQDLLTNKYDEDLFDFLLAADLQKVDLMGKSTPLLSNLTLRSFSLSPNGKYVMTSTLKKPYSYLVPGYRFPYVVEVYDMSGDLVKVIADISLQENIPISFDAASAEPRSHQWNNAKGASLLWVQALDEGNPKVEVEKRDRIMEWESPFEGEALAVFDTELRYSNVDFLESGEFLVYERQWKDRREIRTLLTSSGEERLLVDRSYEDIYNDPGRPFTTKNDMGSSVLKTDASGEYVYMRSSGASEQGNRPFVSKFSLQDGEYEILWRSENPYYELPIEVLSEDLIITRRESKDEQPNYFFRKLDTNEVIAITNFDHPYPQLKNIFKEQIRYERADGIPLTATLYLPEGYDAEKDGRLPVLMWAYPREYKSAQAAGQVRSSQNDFTRVSWASPIFWVLQGYAVMDRTEMPIVGEGDKEPNDTYVDQLILNAEAAIDKIVEMGIGDRERIAIGGHSYGAFMTANLLTNSNLFAAGIARSGAYNRTLTPFGFQREERTYWQAPEVYNAMSPFMSADRMKTPMLLIHGEADNNSGTFPIQSERYYNAIKGHGGIARLVFLPEESHGYRARESVLHMLWEMDTWLDKYVKNKDSN